MVFTVSEAHAAVYQVGPARQYTELGQVTNLLAPGDTVELDGDATYPGGVVFDVNGSPTKKIKVVGIAVNGKRPVLSGGGNTIEAAGDHYEFSGLEITGGTARCFYHHANDITLRDAFVHDCPKQGVLGADNDSGSFLLEYTEVTRCGGGDRDHQIYMATDETTFPGSVFRMQYCYIHDSNGGNNVKSRAERNEIYYNWIEGGFYHELELIGPDPAGGAGTAAREDSDVVGNVLVKTRDFAVVRFGGDATGASSGRYRFVNNTVLTAENGSSAVFRLFDPLQSVQMHNNVFTVLGAGSVNLLREVEALWTDGRQVSGSNNWVKNGSTNVPGEWTGTLTGDDPGFANAATFNLRPNAGSPLIDAGSGAANGPANFEFPFPLPVPAAHPPDRKVGTPGSSEGRPVMGTLDVGAYELGPIVPLPVGSGGAGGSASGGAPAGVTMSGGAATGGTMGAAAQVGGSTSMGGMGNSTGSGAFSGSNMLTPINGAGTNDSSCGCRLVGRASAPSSLFWSLFLGVLAVLRRQGNPAAR